MLFGLCFLLSELSCRPTIQGDGDEEGDVHSVPVDVIPEEPHDSLSPTTPTEEPDTSATELLSACQLLNPFPDGMDEDVPDWFKRFFGAYQRNETRKYILMEETALRLIDFEIRKCELLTDIIRRLKD